MGAPTQKVIQRAEHALDEAAESTWLERLARAGLAARGLLYVVVAILAIKVATGHGRTRADKRGALQAVLRQPFGRVLVLGLAVGFAGYAAWRFVEAAVGPPHEPAAAKAMFRRVGYAARGLLYTFFAGTAVKLFIWSSEATTSDTMEADWTARVLGWPGGTWLLHGVGLGLIAAGLYIGGRGVTGKFRKRLKSLEMGRAERFWVRGAGTFGMLARMVVSILMGALLIVAARQHDPGQAVGIDGALKRLADRPYGPTLLVAVAIGLGAYGLYSFAEARYRRVGGP